MAEYIDRENYCKNICRCSREKCDKAKCPIWTAPAADVREVVRGKWEWFDEECGTPIDGQDREWGWRCSVCKDTLNDEYDDPDSPPRFNVCPNCGADMREEMKK